MSGALPPAVAAALRDVQQRPDQPAAWMRLGTVLSAAGRPAAAARAFGQLAQRAPSPTATQRWVDAALAAGDLALARSILEGEAPAPTDPVAAWRALALAATRAGHRQLAFAAWEGAVARAPAALALRLHAGVAGLAAGQGPAGRRHLECAVALEPENADGWANLAVVCEACNDLPAAEAAAQRARALRPADPHAALVRARVARRRGDPAAALALLDATDVAAGGLRCEIRGWSERGRCRELVGDLPGAVAAWTEMNRRATDRPEHDPARMAAHMAMLAALPAHSPALLAAARVPWVPPADGAPPVFVVGFPRSGTTLLESMLGAHPALVPTDETPALDTVVARAGALAGVPGAYPAVLAGRLADPALRGRLRAAWRAVFQLHHPGLDPARRWIDKMPLNLVHAPLIAALFPDAHLVHIRRDPRDTALSCFAQDFAFNAAMGHTTSLSGIIALQRAAHRCWTAARPGLVLPVHELRYEALVADPEAALRGVLGALGLAWDPVVLDRGARTAGRHISTASYAAVGRPIDTAAVGRWRRAAAALAPWRADLDENARMMGYPVD